MEKIFKLFKEIYEKELKSCYHPNGTYHLESDVWTHTMLVFNQARLSNASKNLQIAALLHDIGKSLSRQELENGKIVFRGHEGISTFESLDFLNILLKENKIGFSDFLEILYLINYHGIFWQKSEKQIKKYFVDGHYDLYEKLYEFSTYDAKGNISFGEFDYKEKILYSENERCFSTLKNNCYIMIGLPNSGKSTYIREYLNDLEILSRDDILMEYGKNKNYGESYSEIWKNLTQEDQKEIDKILQRKFNELRKSDKDFVIDMTNVSIKSRKKWLTQLDNHNAIAIVLLESLNEIFERNEERAEINGKFIPENVLIDFAKRFELPLMTEGFITINYIFGNTSIIRGINF